MTDKLTPQEILAKLREREKSAAPEQRDPPDIAPEHAQTRGDKVCAYLRKRSSEAERTALWADVGLCLASHVEDPFAQEALEKHYWKHQLWMERERASDINAAMAGVPHAPETSGEVIRRIVTEFRHDLVRGMLRERQLYRLSLRTADEGARNNIDQLLIVMEKMRLLAFQTMYLYLEDLPEQVLNEYLFD